MYKNEGLLLYVIAVLYFVLLRFLWSRTSNIFYERFFFLTLRPSPFTQRATTSVQSEMEMRKIGRKKNVLKKKKKMTSSGRLKFFLFLYEL